MKSDHVLEPVGNQELLARFVLFENRVRGDGTVKPDAFMPPPSLELSVTRHQGATEEQLWARGEVVAAASGRGVVGRADITAGVVRAVRPLDAIAAPLDRSEPRPRGWLAADDEQARSEGACTESRRRGRVRSSMGFRP